MADSTGDRIAALVDAGVVIVFVAFCTSLSCYYFHRVRWREDLGWLRYLHFFLAFLIYLVPNIPFFFGLGENAALGFYGPITLAWFLLAWFSPPEKSRRALLPGVAVFLFFFVMFAITAFSG